MEKIALLSIACILHATAMLAQPKPGSIAGQTMVRIRSSSGGELSTGISGVVVKAYTVKDTLYTTTVNGVFQFKKVTAGPVTLRFSHLSYKDVIKEIEVRPGQTTEVDIRMQEAPQQIDAVTVKGETRVLKVSGDTLIYNAAAVRTLEGDETMKIVEQLPGVLTSEAGVSVMGKDIDRTYIDGKLIFGSDPMAALQNLLANDVLKIRVYDEYADDNPHRKRRKGDEMRRVFNIETKSKLIQATTGHFLASYGADMNKGGRGNHDRYGIGATANFFSESLLLSANAFFNNINRKSNRISDIIAVKSPKSSYDRSTYVNAGIEKNWYSKRDESTPITLNASYTYGNDYSRSENALQQIYFPSADYTSRTYADTTRNIATRKVHENNVRFMHDAFLSGQLDIDHHLTFEDDGDRSYRSGANRVDAAPATGSRSNNRLNRKFYTLSEELRWNSRFGGIVNFDFNFKADLSDGDGRGMRIDTLSSTATRKVLDLSPDWNKSKYEAGAGVSFRLSEQNSSDFSLGYRFIYDHSMKKQAALNIGNPDAGTIDATNTYNYTNDYRTHQASAAFKFAFPQLKMNLSFGATVQTATLNRNERVPGPMTFDNRFNAVLPVFSIMSVGKITRSTSLNYFTMAQLPSVEQLRPQIDNTNPYMLVGGNPNLKQSYRHYVKFQHQRLIGKTANTLVMNLDMHYTGHLIAPKRIFIAQGGSLPGWDYDFPAQSTLTTYENVDGMWSVVGSVKWIRPLRKLKSQLTVNPVFNYDNSPSYVNDALNRTRSYDPELNISLNTTLSRSFRFSVGTFTSYIFSSNTVHQDDKYFRQGVSSKGELTNIFKRFYLNTAYSLSYYKRFSGDRYDLNNQILNVAVGCKVLKRRGDISFTAYDILNRNSGYKTAMYSDYIQNTWTRSFGRYFTFNIAYKFNKSKSGVTNDSIKDGSVKE